MGNYSIRELEVLTGVKAHTIRIWEQRYNILAPNRTDTNIRFYTEEDLKHLLNVSLLNKNGYKISKISKMSEKDVREKVMDFSEKNFEFINQIDALTVAMIEFNEDGFEKLLATNILRIGFEETFINIIFPFLNRVGLLWQTAVIGPAQEHFISNLIRQKIIVAIDTQMPVKTEKTKRYILFLPEKELHEHSLLFTNFIIRARGGQTLFLGTSVPIDDLISAHKYYKPDYLLTLCIAHPSEHEVTQYLNQLSQLFPQTEILASGKQAIDAFGQNIEAFNPAITVFSNLQQAVSFFEESIQYPNKKY